MSFEFITFDEARALSLELLTLSGLSASHADALTTSMVGSQRDECHSHGLYRILGCIRTVKEGKVDPLAVPAIDNAAPGIVRVDCGLGFSLLGFQEGLPALVQKTRQQGIAAMAIRRCFHFSALWPEIEAITAQGLVALAMTPSHAWVAPAGGTRGVFGTNPFAFGWPRGSDRHPFVFDFATSAAARGEIELHRRAGKPIPLGWAVDTEGKNTTDAEAAMKGAMLTFGGHKGSALAAMIELLAGPLIGEMTSAQSMAFDGGAGLAPCHGELIMALDPASFLGGGLKANTEGAEEMFASILSQGARLPSQRRYAAREHNLAAGTMPVDAALLRDLRAELKKLTGRA